ncbi:TrbI/VirB10 family protein [Variovorax sp. RCC_210]|uniref:TrbI/VirB10 family protein n=1 Tax=Variovorax sp. RCC_210 TaxID=3239217 RepID=UPI0035263FF1
MFKTRHEQPLAEEERDGIVEAPRRSSPGQKLILGATSAVAALLILFGVASRNNYFGVFGASSSAKGEVQLDTRPTNVPEIPVPLSAGAPVVPSPAAVECPGGLRLPPGMECPPQRMPAAVNDPPPAGQSLAQRVRERRFKGAIALGGAAGAGGAVRPVATAGESVGVANATGSVATGALGRSLNGTDTRGARAWVIATPSFTLAKGTLPDCTLLTAILTDQPGFLKCVLSAPVMSMDGKVVLMEAGTSMEGEYTAGVQAGQTTIFTLWTRAVTPNFIAVPLSSPGTDALGRAGSSGFVDNKWMERFAGAVFFSLFEDAKQVAIARDDARAARRVGSQTGVTYNIGSQGTLAQLGNTGSTTQSIVQEMLRQGSQARPSLYKNQGEVVRIFVARDVDFSDVYELRAAPAPGRP